VLVSEDASEQHGDLARKMKPRKTDDSSAGTANTTSTASHPWSPRMRSAIEGTTAGLLIT
jgi:hypothetical protein